MLITVMHSSVSNSNDRQHHASFSILLFTLSPLCVFVVFVPAFFILVVFLLLRAKVHSVLHENCKTLS